MARSPYTTIRPTFGPAPTWVTSVEDQERLQAYQRYEEMYWNEPDAYKLILRGSETNPVYIPSAMTCIEATNRYLAKGWTFTPDPKLGSPQERQLLQQLLTQTFRREKVWSKFNIQKRYNLIRGDAIWYLIGDPLKPLGRRLRVLQVDPSCYFPITDPLDDQRIIGVHLAESVFALDDKTPVVKRQTYRKDPESGTITYEMTWWEPGGWDDRNLEPQDLKPAKVEVKAPAQAAVPLPPQITALPVYHIQVNSSGGPFGSSEMRGMETLAAAVSQTVSDEELALALSGLGIYVTTSGPPVNDDGDEVAWQIGPGYVAEIDPEADWKRVNGVTSVDPSQSHARYLESKMREARGIPDVAIGNVDVAVAESGIALALKMAPILSANGEKEQEMLGTYDQMLYDLSTMWLPAYEQTAPMAAVAVSVVDEPLPINRTATLTEIQTMVDMGLITVEYARQLVSEKLGYEFPEEMAAAVVTEMTELAKARNADPFLDRVGRELDNEGGTPS